MLTSGYKPVRWASAVGWLDPSVHIRYCEVMQQIKNRVYSHLSTHGSSAMSNRRNRCRRGSVLVEFALVALPLYLLLAAVLTFGFLFWSGSAIQQAAEVGAQEIARMPLPPDELELGLGNLSPPPEGTIMDRDDFKQQIYDEAKLVIPQDLVPEGTRFADYAAANLPLINRLLSSVYIFDANYGAGVYRYPGAIVQRNGSETYDTVLIPVVTSAGGIEWVAPVEEMRVQGVGPFKVSAVAPVGADSFVPGTVALRINYPYQSAAMSGFGPAQNPVSNIDQVISAKEPSGGDPVGYTLQVDANAYATGVQDPHGGRYGMGQQGALPFDDELERHLYGVRPYRKVISAQAIFRREAFGD